MSEDRRICLLLIAATTGCGGGDNGAVGAFHPTVAVGDAVPELIADRDPDL